MLQLNEIKTDGYERVVQGVDNTTGLEAIVAIHNTNLGPALGGCRAMPYDNSGAQLKDVLRLSKGMTYKSALAGLDLGGGKSTINTRGSELTDDMLKSFGEMLNDINSSGDLYYTAGDIGTSTGHLAELAKHTRFVNGDQGTDSGIATAYGVFAAARGALRFHHDQWDLQSVSISGLGKVGDRLAKFVGEQNPSAMFLSDIDSWTKRQTVMRRGGTMGNVEDAHVGVTMYMPCAVGGTVNERTINEMANGTIICGAANNQLDTDDAAAFLRRKGISYVPDYLANAGGVIIVTSRGRDLVDLEYDSPEILPKLDQLDSVTYDILDRADRENKSTVEIANRMAEERFNV